MATINKTFSFLSTLEGFVGYPQNTDVTLSYDSGVGNPSGSLKSRLFGRNKTAASYWGLATTWEALGVPAGAIVTQVRLNSAHNRCTEYNVVDICALGPYNIYSSDGTVLIATLWTGRSATGVEGSWTSVGVQSYQAIAGAYQASNTTVRLRLNNNLDNANNASAAVSIYDDTISYDIDYTIPADALDAVGITVNPITGTPTIGQVHILDATSTTVNPVLGTPTVTDVPSIDDLTAVGITTTPVLDTPTIGQIHVLDAVDITANPVVGVPTLVYTVDTLWDDFDDNSQDTGKWEKGGSDLPWDDALVTVLEQNNRLEIQPRDGMPSTHYNGYKSVSLFSLIDSAFFVEITQLETAGGANTQLYLQSGAQDSLYSLRIEYDSAEIYLGYRGSGAADWVTQTWNGTAMRWWRIIYDTPSANVLWQYSPDGLNWTTGRTVAASVLTTAGIDLVRLRASISAGTWASVTTPLATYFDNVSHHPLVPRFEEYTNGPVNILSKGDTAEYDEILWGGQSPASIIKFNGLFFMYYNGADGYDNPLDTPTNRALCLATSPDGVNWTKYASNPVVTYTTGGSVEEGVGGAALIVNGSTIHLYYSAIRDIGGGNVDLDIRYRSSTDGYSFGSDQLILTVPGDEYNPQIVIHDGTDYHLYITGPMVAGKAVVRRYSGSSPTSLTFQEITLNEIIGAAKGIDPNTLITTDDVVMILDYRNSARKRYQIRTVDKTVPANFGQWLFQWTIGVWGDTGNVNILYDDVNDVWFIYAIDLTNGANAGDIVSYWLGTPNTPLTSVDITTTPVLGTPTVTDVPGGGPIATDDFNRADGGLGSDWADSCNLSSLHIDTNEAAGDAGAERASIWITDTPNDDQYAKAKWVNGEASQEMGPGVRGSSSDLVFVSAAVGYQRIYWWNFGAKTEIGSTYVGGLSTGDILTIEAEGTTFRVYEGVTEIINGSNASAPAGGQGGMYMYEQWGRLDDFEVGNLVGGTTDDLTAVGITTAPVLGTPAIAQIHVLDAVDITTTPVLGTPAIAQIHVLDAVDITVNPVLGTPILASLGEDNLDAVDITVNPVLDTSSIGQIHVLDAVDISTTPVLGTSTLATIAHLDAVDISTTPVLGTSTLATIAHLDAVDISTTPVLGTPILGSLGEDSLDAVDISTTPVLGAPSIGQEHVLDAVDISTTPVLGTSTLTTVDHLDAVDISTTPVVETSTIGQIHALDAVDISTTPVLGTSSIGQIHALDAVDISTTPVLGTSTLATIAHLDSVDISTTPILGLPSIGQEHALDAVDISTTPVLGTPIIGSIGTDNLESVGITVTPLLDTPAIGQTHVLSSVGITATSEFGTPTVSIIHPLNATDATTTPVFEIPTIGQIHALFATDISATPEFELPTSTHIHVLNAVPLETTPVLETSGIGQIHVLNASEISVSPIFGTPVFGQTHIITALGIIATPELGVATTDKYYVSGEIVSTFSTELPQVIATAIKPIVIFTNSMED